MSLRRLYETTFIVNAALEDADIESVVSKVTGYLTNHGAEILEVNKWGRRRLAYPINKKFNGFYVHLVFETVPSTIPILERYLVLEDTVLRNLTLILPLKLREFRAKRALLAGLTSATLPPPELEPKKSAEERRRLQRMAERAANQPQIQPQQAAAVEPVPEPVETVITEVVDVKEL